MSSQEQKEMTEAAETAAAKMVRIIRWANIRKYPLNPVNFNYLLNYPTVCFDCNRSTMPIDDENMDSIQAAPYCTKGLLIPMEKNQCKRAEAYIWKN